MLQRATARMLDRTPRQHVLTSRSSIYKLSFVLQRGSTFVFYRFFKKCNFVVHKNHGHILSFLKTSKRRWSHTASNHQRLACAQVGFCLLLDVEQAPCYSSENVLQKSAQLRTHFCAGINIRWYL